MTASAKTADTFVVFLSGDGGWRPLDVAISQRLALAGMPVVGFLSSDYMRTRRKPDEAGADLEKVIRQYSAKWNRPRIVLIGFSRGADILPFMAARLPADLRSQVRLVALLGIEPEIEFKYHPTWIPFYHPYEEELLVAPEVEKLRGTNILCILGDKEDDSLCPALDPALARSVEFSGGHHFGRHYDEVSRAILDAIR